MTDKKKKPPASKKPPPEAEAPLPVERLPPAKPVKVPDPPVVVVVEPEYRRRSSVTGKFVTAWFAIRHPRITMRERRKK